MGGGGISKMNTWLQGEGGFQNGLKSFTKKMHNPLPACLHICSKLSAWFYIHVHAKRLISCIENNLSYLLDINVHQDKKKNEYITLLMIVSNLIRIYETIRPHLMYSAPLSETYCCFNELLI